MVELYVIPSLILFIFFLLTLRELSYLQNIRGVSKKRYFIIRRTYRMFLVYIIYFFIYQIVLEYVNRYNNDIIIKIDPLLRIIIFFTLSLVILILIHILWTFFNNIFDPVIYESVILDPPVMGDIETKEFLFSSIIPKIKREKNTLLFMLNNLLINLKNKSKFQTFELKFCLAEVYEFKWKKFRRSKKMLFVQEMKYVLINSKPSLAPNRNVDIVIPTNELHLLYNQVHDHGLKDIEFTLTFNDAFQRLRTPMIYIGKIPNYFSAIHNGLLYLFFEDVLHKEIKRNQDSGVIALLLVTLFKKYEFDPVFLPRSFVKEFQYKSPQFKQKTADIDKSLLILQEYQRKNMLSIAFGGEKLDLYIKEKVINDLKELENVYVFEKWLETTKTKVPRVFPFSHEDLNMEELSKLLNSDDEYPFIDKKVSLNISTREKKADFIKDIIALGNEATKKFRISYLVIGVDQSGEPVEEYDLLEDDNTFQGILKAYIAPIPDVLLLKREYKNRIIDIFSIIPNRKPYRVKRDYKGDKNKLLLEKGLYFHRIGSSNSLAEPEEAIDWSLEFDKHLSEWTKGQSK